MIEIRNRLSKAGWNVFPDACRWGGLGGNAVPPAANDKRWLSTSKLTLAVPDGVLFIDYDGYKPGAISGKALAVQLGFANWEDMCRGLMQYRHADNGQLSAHFAYRLPAGAQFKNGTGILPGVDVRTLGGVIHIKTNKTIHQVLTPSELPEFPLTALHLLKPRDEVTTPDNTTPVKQALTTSLYGKRVVDAELMALSGVAEGARDQEIFTRGSRLFELVAGGEITDEDAVNALKVASETNGWLVDVGESAFNSKVNHCRNTGFKKPRCAPGETQTETDEPIELEAIELADKIKKMLDNSLMMLGGSGESVIDASIINKIIRSSFWSHSKNSIGIVSDKERYVKMFKADRMWDFITRNFKDPLTNRHDLSNALQQLYSVTSGETSPAKLEKFANDILKMVRCEVCDFLIDNRQRESREYEVDMFGKSSRIDMIDGSAKVIFPHRVFPVDGEIDERVVTDYKEHFSQLDEVLEMIVNARFASDRKNAYLWLYCDSDWGKSFFMSSLSQAGGSVETSMIELKTMMQGNPSGLSPEKFISSMALCIDEFKVVNSELKQAQNYINFAPKQQLTVTVPVYAKLLFSAETVGSLVGSHGVEDQFSNRMSMIRGTGTLNDRHVFKDVGNLHYFKSVANYIARQMNALVDERIALGLEEGTKMSQNKLNKFHEKYGLSNTYQTLSESVSDIADDFVEWAIQEHQGQNAFIENNTIFIKRALSLFEHFVNDTIDKSGRQTILRKRAEVFEQFKPSQTHRIALSSKPIKAISREIKKVT